MATVEPWTPIMTEKIWTDEEKQEWLASHGRRAHPRRHVRADVPDRGVHPTLGAPGPPDRPFRGRVGQEHATGPRRPRPVGADVVAAHHEGNSLEVYTPSAPPGRAGSPEFATWTDAARSRRT